MQKGFKIVVTGAGGIAGIFILATLFCLHPVTSSLRSIASSAQTAQITDRNAISLSQTYQNHWNTYDIIPLYQVPDFLKTAFLQSEDRQFYGHHGVNWNARAAALWQNFRNDHVVRGASTIGEQVVRMINPRPRTLWSKWLEGIEATMLDMTAGKADIFEFYLNQIPYAANRRGVVQAARYYFGRSPETLTQREMLALVIMARAPSAYDLYHSPGQIDGAITRLADQMLAQKLITGADHNRITSETLQTSGQPVDIGVGHFARYVRQNAMLEKGGVIRTTLDVGLQGRVLDILNQRIATLATKNVHNGAALVIDHQTGDILAWAVAGNDNTPGVQIDAVLTPRQPGSAMKPFLYAAALEKGWNSATLIDDSPMAEAVGTGLHRFRNYSNVYYGPVTLREALGNSLNIPALRTIGYVGTGNYLSLLHRLGFAGLDRGSDIYDEGLALGDGEVSLFELTGAYTALANHGVYHAPRVLMNAPSSPGASIYSNEVASLMGNILSDPWARQMEFGAGSVLNLPVQTAVKTGTSTDYRDAWVVGYNDRYTVGLWMGNLDRTPMQGVTGSLGPALAMRSIFAVLNANRETSRLYISPRLIQEQVCIRPSRSGEPCLKRADWFVPGSIPQTHNVAEQSKRRVIMTRPTEGLQIAYDPRIPSENQKFRFELSGLEGAVHVQWIVDGIMIAENDQSTLLWSVVRGRHRLGVNVRYDSDVDEHLNVVNFIVK